MYKLVLLGERGEGIELGADLHGLLAASGIYILYIIYNCIRCAHIIYYYNIQIVTKTSEVQ